MELSLSKKCHYYDRCELEQIFNFCKRIQPKTLPVNRGFSIYTIIVLDQFINLYTIIISFLFLPKDEGKSLLPDAMQTAESKIIHYGEMFADVLGEKTMLGKDNSEKQYR